MPEWLEVGQIAAGIIGMVVGGMVFHLPKVPYWLRRFVQWVGRTNDKMERLEQAVGQIKGDADSIEKNVNRLLWALSTRRTGQSDTSADTVCTLPYSRWIAARS